MNLQVPSPLERGAGWRDYLAMTKPREVSLLLFTTLAAMLMAQRGLPPLGLLLAVALGGYMAAGAASVFNMVLDRDIDQRMHRTAKRATASGRVSTAHALLFGSALAAGSVLLLSAAANPLTAGLAMAGLAVYVLVYTKLLKRVSWQNIVIGGAAGCFPPLVGWAAVTGGLGLLPWDLFAIIFFWTPVHFWALSLLIQGDYAEAGIPMLPVVYGSELTAIQIWLYAILTALFSLLPLITLSVGLVYLVAAVLLDALLLWRALQLRRQPDRQHALALYLYSLLYLALLFSAMAIDRMHLL